jgi:hypothetical protein
VTEDPLQSYLDRYADPETDSCTVIERSISGPCTACRRNLGHEVHVSGQGAVHPECCAFPKHGRGKSRSRQAVVGGQGVEP